MVYYLKGAAAIAAAPSCACLKEYLIHIPDGLSGLYLSKM